MFSANVQLLTSNFRTETKWEKVGNYEITQKTNEKLNKINAIIGYNILSTEMNSLKKKIYWIWFRRNAEFSSLIWTKKDSIRNEDGIVDCIEMIRSSDRWDVSYPCIHNLSHYEPFTKSVQNDGQFIKFSSKCLFPMSLYARRSMRNERTDDRCLNFFDCI